MLHASMGVAPCLGFVECAVRSVSDYVLSSSDLTTSSRSRVPRSEFVRFYSSHVWLIGLWSDLSRYFAHMMQMVLAGEACLEVDGRGDHAGAVHQARSDGLPWTEDSLGRAGRRRSSSSQKRRIQAECEAASGW